MERDARSRPFCPSILRVAVSLGGLTLAAAGLGRVPPPRLMVRWEPLAIVSSWGAPTVRADLGRIRVPENRASGSARQIELAFVRIPALSPSGYDTTLIGRTVEFADDYVHARRSLADDLLDAWQAHGALAPPPEAVPASAG